MNATVQYRWGVRFIIPGLRLNGPVCIGGIEFVPHTLDADGRPQSTGYLRLEYSDCVQQHTVERDAHGRIELLFDAISLVATVGHCREVSARLENDEELRSHGLPVPLSASFTCPVSTTVPPTEGVRLSAAYTNLVGQSEEKRSLYHRVSRWTRRLYGETDVFDRFMSRWIAFNVLYEPYHQEGERNAIERFIQGEFDQTTSRAFVQRVNPRAITLLAESGLTLTTRKGDLRVADDLHAVAGTPEETKDHFQVVRLLTLTLYALRNAVFHGTLVDEDRSAVELVRNGSDVLASLITDVLHRCTGLSSPAAT